MVWRVSVEYSLSLGVSAMDSAIEQAAGRPRDFSGAGMGMRDVGWRVGSEIEAARIKRSLKKIGLAPVVKAVA